LRIQDPLFFNTPLPHTRIRKEFLPNCGSSTFLCEISYIIFRPFLLIVLLYKRDTIMHCSSTPEAARYLTSIF
jgi:hypothetical protein